MKEVSAVSVMTASRTPYSAMVWPSSWASCESSFCISCRPPEGGLVSHRPGERRARSPATGIQGTTTARLERTAFEPRRSVRRCVLRDVAGDAGDGVHDVARKEGKCAKDRDRDDSKDDAVLGHRLPIFTSEPVVELLHRADLHGESVGGGPSRRFAMPLHRPRPAEAHPSHEVF